MNLRRRVMGCLGRPDEAEAWLHFHELDAIHLLLDLHQFQLEQLSYGEFRRAYLTTEGQVKSRGGAVQRQTA